MRKLAPLLLILSLDAALLVSVHAYDRAVGRRAAPAVVGQDVPVGTYRIIQAEPDGPCFDFDELRHVQEGETVDEFWKRMDAMCDDFCKRAGYEGWTLVSDDPYFV